MCWSCDHPGDPGPITLIICEAPSRGMAGPCKGSSVTGSARPGPTRRASPRTASRNLWSLAYRCGGQRACYISDLIPTTAHLDLTWVLAYDLFPLETIESRKRFYEHAVPERWLVLFTHDPAVPWAIVESPRAGKYQVAKAQ